METTTHPDANDDCEEITRAFHDARSPLTILSGRTQLLYRRIAQGRIDDPRTCLVSLEAMHRAARDLETRLQDLEQIVRGREAGRNATESPHDM